MSGLNSNEFKKMSVWKGYRYKITSFSIGMTALLIYEFIGLPIYRPYIYSNKINDFHIADTLGNTLGTIALIYLLIAIFSYEKAQGKVYIKMGIVIALLMELLHPLLGKSIDLWDMIATVIAGILSFIVFHYLFKDPDKTTHKKAWIQNKQFIADHTGNEPINLIHIDKWLFTFSPYLYTFRNCIGKF